MDSNRLADKGLKGFALWVWLVLLATGVAAAKGKPEKAGESLTEYIAKVRATSRTTPTTGSLWTPQSPFANMARDYKARAANDLIIIRVIEQTSAVADGTVKSKRDFSASSGISGLFGQVGARSGLQTIFSPNSQRALDGQAQTSSNSQLTASLAGHVAEVLPNGFLVIEAERQVDMNNQRQTLVVRGVVRPGDVGPDNSVLSTAMSNLEVELKGHGVISDGVRPPNRILRAILRIVGF
jgi:flagellar L-ring protein precursor FlgH